MAWTNSSKLRLDTKAKILCLAFAMVCNIIFLELCPGYLNQPNTEIDHIPQVYTDCNSNQVISTVQAYFQQLLGTARPFSSQCNFPVKVCTKFQDGLEPCLQMGYCQYFPQHSVVQSLNATHQRKTFKAIPQAAQQAEKNLHALQRIAGEAAELSQAFHASTSGGLLPTLGAFPSQAKNHSWGTC